MRIQGRHYRTGEQVEVVCAGDTIQSSGKPSGAPVDVRAGWLAPAFFDLQINGCGGRSFASVNLSVEDVRYVVNTCRRHGISTLLATLITNSFSTLSQGFRTLVKACDSDRGLAAAIPGFHLEGPYVSPDDGPRGAHPRQHVRPPEWDEFCRLQDAAQGRIRLLTLAPEWDGAVSLIEQAVKSGVVVALGHTAAGRDCIRAAIAAGARLSTHLGNGSHAMLPRHNNYIWEQLAADELWASVICDGHHLPAAVVRCILRMKGAARTILTCDASGLAGSPPGRYHLWEQEFEVQPEGKIVLPGTEYLAGSWAFTDRCIGNVIRFADVSLGDAIEMASARPRELLGLEQRRLEPGYPADLVLFDWQEQDDLTVRSTIVGGVIHAVC
jgi:N-acetylglucosamine-6-phosphate deacetylase